MYASTDVSFYRLGVKLCSDIFAVSAIVPPAIQILTPGITSLLAASELHYYVEASYFAAY